MTSLNLGQDTPPKPKKTAGDIVDDIFRELDVSVVTSDNPGYHGEQLIPKVGRVLVRRVGVLVQAQFRETTLDRVYYDFERDLSVAMAIRRQEVSGSTDEKLVSSIKVLESCVYPIGWLILMGSGFRQWTRREAIETANRITKSSNKLIRVIDACDESILRRYAKALVETGNPGGKIA